MLRIANLAEVCGLRSLSTFLLTHGGAIMFLLWYVTPRTIFVEEKARGEALPLAERSIDVAICLSSIRHVKDRARTFAELRRVVRDRVVIVELDPDADGRRIAAHADRLGSAVLRVAFGPLRLASLGPGQARLLTPAEVERLMKTAESGS